MAGKDYYEILGVKKTASEAEFADGSATAHLALLGWF